MAGHERHVLAEDAFAEIVVLARAARRSRLDAPVQVPFGAGGRRRCDLRYDNEAGKGDHRHLGDIETAYVFSSYEKLMSDFWTDVEAWRR